MSSIRRSRPWAVAGPGFVAGLVLLGALALPAQPAAAGSDIRVYVDGVLLPTDTPVAVVSDRTLLPVRAIFEALGAEVSWDQGSLAARAFGPSIVITVFAGRPEAEVSGEQVTMDVAPALIGGRLYVPVRFVAQALGAGVAWDEARRAVLLETPDGAAGRTVAAGVPTAGGSGLLTEEEVRATYSPEDIELLARVINAEAYGQPYEGNVAVGAVVVNRMAHPWFPNTLREVIMQPGQFLVVWNGQINRAVHPDSRLAAIDALRGIDPSNGALFFYNPKKSTSTFWRDRPVTVVIADHTFTK